MGLKEVDALTELRRFVEKHGSQKAAAEALGIGQVYMSDLMNQRRDVSVAILEKLGLREVVVRQSA